MNNQFYKNLTETALQNTQLDSETCHDILESDKIDLLSLLDAAYRVRHHYHKKEVAIHIINNAQNGSCPEDCNYCAQGQASEADIPNYKLNSFSSNYKICFCSVYSIYYEFLYNV